MNKVCLIIFTVFIISNLVSCSPSKSTSSSVRNSESNPAKDDDPQNPDPNPTTAPENGDSDDDSSEVIAVDNPWTPQCDIQGVSNPNPSATNYRIWCKNLEMPGRSAGDGTALEDGVYWSAFHHYRDKASAFKTDSNIKFRIKVNYEPNYCNGMDGKPRQYDQLRMKIRIKYLDSDGVLRTGDDINTDWIKVGETSPTMTLPAGITDGPQYIEIMNVASDYACKLNYPEDDYNGYCSSGWAIPSNACWSINLQVATSYTQQFP